MKNENLREVYEALDIDNLTQDEIFILMDKVRDNGDSLGTEYKQEGIKVIMHLMSLLSSRLDEISEQGYSNSAH